MRINGDFVLREIAGDYVLIPTGETALKMNGMIMFNEVGAYIWQAVAAGQEREEILAGILNEFETDRETAEADMNEFLENMEKGGFLRS